MTNNPINQTREDLSKRLFRRMSLIRNLEEGILDLFSNDEIAGTTHTSIGQEAIAVSVLDHISEDDVVFSNHRCHAHYIAYGGPVEPLVAEIMGKEDGLCGGRGGSQHLTYRNFHTNGVQGGIVANCTGAALAKKIQDSNGIGIVFLGDGTLGEGITYESLNMASLWKIPILFVLENNGIAQSTPIDFAVAGSIAERARAFGIETNSVETNDAILLHSLFKNIVTRVRSTRQPLFQIVNTFRLGPHSKGDDDFRAEAELTEWSKKDPLLLMRKYLDDKSRTAIERKTHQTVQTAITRSRALHSPRKGNTEADSHETLSPSTRKTSRQFQSNQELTVLESLNNSLHNLLRNHNDVVMIGQDILDPYGGAFKVTRGLSTAFPERVFTTPISEGAIVGLSVGMALYGIRPVAEIMFGDFLTLCADQIINHASKYQWMYNNQVNVPLVVRTAMGGGRGYGPTHSQSLEKLFIGVPGLAVIAPSHLHDPGHLLEKAVLEVNSPVLFVEHKLLYPKRLLGAMNGRINNFFIRSSKQRFPTIHLSLSDFEVPDATIVTYGGNVPMAMEAAETLLINHEINIDIVVPSLISPVPENDMLKMIGLAPIVVTLEEGSKRHGWGAEIIACIEEATHNIRRRHIRIAASDSPIPSSKQLESELLPNINTTVELIRGAIH